MKTRTRNAGFTLVEAMIVLAIAGVIAALSVPAFANMIASQRLRASAQMTASAMSYAHDEAIRTGNIHLVFFSTDADLNALTDAGGNAVDILVINDGRPGDLAQNCAIDAGERVADYALSLQQGITFGVTNANAAVASDSGGGAVATGSTFADAGGAQASWVMFRPEGVPFAFSDDCTMGAIGTGAGGMYFTNGARDLAIVLTPLGLSHAYSWDLATAGWSN